ncbi:TetR/AcrR family transcriptional regulator [Pseudogulbenkiania sp. MAI-1]|uniref:TetR/AcrR family transcriptional regulator n=1 Tax=Pseudogulbenkiania sp. MAI-1 TaxID=990370 RepID=UPI0004BC3A5B|nr:TetR/AcrR family transcriptional regulator [Pseudogulbenkiania sp. MAI-1]
MKSETKRQSIIDAAAAVFMEQGFSAASMSDIASRAGGSKATLYSYFPSKEELFGEVMRDLCVARVQPVFAALETGGEPAEALELFGIRFLQEILSPDLLAIRRMVVAEAGRSNIGQQFYNQGPKAGRTRIAQFLEQQMQMGRMKKADPWRATIYLMALLTSDLADECLWGVREKPSDQEITEHVHSALAVFFAAYGAPPSTQS